MKGNPIDTAVENGSMTKTESRTECESNKDSHMDKYAYEWVQAVQMLPRLARIL